MQFKPGRFWLWIVYRYYCLEVSYFKSSLDRKLLGMLWNKYWVNTLSSSSLLTVSFKKEGIKRRKWTKGKRERINELEEEGKEKGRAKKKAWMCGLSKIW